MFVLFALVRRTAAILDVAMLCAVEGAQCKTRELPFSNSFAHESLPVDAVYSRWSVIYKELKDIFKENKHGFES